MNWIGDDVGGLYGATYRHVVNVIDDIDPVRFWPHLKRFKAESFVVTRPLPEGAMIAVDRKRPYMPICTEGFKAWCEERGAKAERRLLRAADIRRRHGNNLIGFPMVLRTVAVAIGLLGIADVAYAQTGITELEALVGRLSADVVVSSTAFDATFGTKLIEEESTRYFVGSDAANVVLDGIRFREIELRTRRLGSEASAGPILVLTLASETDNCISRRDVRQAYPDLEWVGAPSPTAMDPDEMLEQRQGPARLIFGFPAFGADCLRTIVYRFDEPL